MWTGPGGADPENPVYGRRRLFLAGGQLYVYLLKEQPNAGCDLFMLFKRRQAQTFWQKTKNLVWPTMGFRRVLDYYKHRSIRIPASEHSIAAGLAFGCLVSWTPLFGTHLIQCAVFAWITRTSLIAAFIGSAFGNFITTPILMLIAYQAGKMIMLALGLEHLLTGHEQAVTEVTEQSLEATSIFLPTLIGGYAVGIATFPLFYYPFYYMVKGARAARRARIERRAHKHAMEVTGQSQ